jgi:hypothetical protein
LITAHIWTSSSSSWTLQNELSESQSVDENLWIKNLRTSTLSDTSHRTYWHRTQRNFGPFLAKTVASLSGLWTNNAPNLVCESNFSLNLLYFSYEKATGSCVISFIAVKAR